MSTKPPTYSAYFGYSPYFGYPNGYIAVGYLLFLQEQIKDIIIITVTRTQVTSNPLHVYIHCFCKNK